MNFALVLFLFVFLCCSGVYSDNFTVGDVCSMKDRTPGVCGTCNGRQNVCGFINGRRYKCCPGPTTQAPEVTTQAPEVTTKPPSISKLKCDEYSRHGYNYVTRTFNGVTSVVKSPRCGSPRPMVVGGERAEAKEFPHMAILGIGNINSIKWFCGGSLISERFVLTAAHCIKSSGVDWVRLGDLNLVRDDDDAAPETIGVEQMIKHPKYRSSSHYNDIALIKLQRDVDFSAYIRPACLNSKKSFRPEAFVIASGWGKNDSNADQGTDDLMLVKIKIISFAKCSIVYRHLLNTPKLRSGITTDLVCAGDSYKDTCQGDSGGPLQIYIDHCMYSIIGVTSFGLPGCGIGNSSGVYTKVASFIPWIEENVWS